MATVTGYGCYQKYGDPRGKEVNKYLETWNVPDWVRKEIPIIPKRIHLNKELKLPLENAFYNMIDRGVCHEVITWDGCYLVRPIRGKEDTVKRFTELSISAPTAKERQIALEKAMIYMSIHSWGLAVDINRKTNGLGQTPTMSKTLVSCFTDAGFEWGGNWPRKDGMHFQLAYLTK